MQDIIEVLSSDDSDSDLDEVMLTSSPNVISVMLREHDCCDNPDSADSKASDLQV